ncbi:Ankyrin repeat-containing protein [Apostasia shenzhenica]|uniref:Ankyrin repeat-containing protein n=1 Tax=Apostasia shenzhenica TaxID=1088818 RepID=A0A2I0B455_9ASPA|nr:Ankyrin repeat-containing protein [Apostasia shenzhenica]
MKSMLQEQEVRPRRQLSTRNSFKLGTTDRDDRGWTLLHIGARKGHLKEVKRFLDEGMAADTPAWGPKSQGETPLHLAAQGGHIKVMDLLLDHGANIDARTKGACGWIEPGTPLHSATKARNKEAVRFLIENGAFLPPDMHDNRFNPPLHYCPGLEWAYEIKRMQQEGGDFSTGETCSSEN